MTTWQTLLANYPVNTSVNPASDGAVYPLSHQRFVVVKGPDAAKFLQGQLSCDIRLLSLQQSGIATHNTAKGRMLSSFRIAQTDEQHYLLSLHHSIAASAKAALAKYIVFSKATIELAEEITGIGLCGSKARQALQKLLPEVPAQDYQQCQHQGLTLVCTSAEFSCYEIYAEQEKAFSLFSQLAGTLEVCDEKQHIFLQQQMGLAFVEAATADEFVPQMFNYQLTPAISFKKGCYTGQEIVARMQYLGKLKRHMYRFSTCIEKPVAVGDKVFLQPDGQSVGEIVSAVGINHHEWQLLMVLTDEAAAADCLYTEQQALPQLRRLPLPYSLPSED